MKKVLTFVLVLAIALTCCMAVIPASAEAENLLGANGNAATASVEGNSAEPVLGKWAGWVDHQGGYRKVVSDAVLSDGSTGSAIEVGIAESQQGHGAFVNNVTVAGLKANQDYIFSVSVKFTAPDAIYDGNGLAVGCWNTGIGIGASFDGTNWQSKKFEKKYDGQWHTYEIGITTPDSVLTGYTFSVGAINGELYVPQNVVMLIESASLVEFNAGDNLLGKNGTPALAVVKDNNVDDTTDCWSGWVQYQGGYRTVSNATLSNGKVGSVIEIGIADSEQNYGALNNVIGVKGLKASTKYVFVVKAKLTTTDSRVYDENNNARTLNGGYIGVGVNFGTESSTLQAKFFNSANDGQWVKYELEVTTPDTLKATDVANFAVGGLLDAYVWEGSVLQIESAGLYEGAAPTGDASLAVVAVFAVALAAAVVFTKKRAF